MDDKRPLGPLPFVLVAEASTLPVIGVVVAGLRKHANPSSISVVVPNPQIIAFEDALKNQAAVISEDKLLPDWPLERVRQRLAHPDRAGWYLQQFLKLSFGQFSGAGEYVIWDADTVPLAAPQIGDGEFTLFGKADEYHKPYFETYRKILGQEPVLPTSAISQYMRINTSVVLSMQKHICVTTGETFWIDGILAALSGKSISEFSEYETYANYFMTRYPSRGSTKKIPWFRYGSVFYPNFENLRLKQIEGEFSHYEYVAFERHKLSSARKIAATSKYAAHKYWAKLLKLWQQS